MIHVTIELIPGGNWAKRRTLDTISIANVSELADVSDYSVEHEDLELRTHDAFRVTGHRPDRGMWPLLREVFHWIARREAPRPKV